MTSSTLSIVPATTRITVAGAVPYAETAPSSLRSVAARTAFARATTPDYFGWLDHVRGAAGCTRPIRLRGQLAIVEAGTGQVLGVQHTDSMPDHAIYKPCGNRRARLCPSCSRTYQGDAYQILRTMLVGGRGITEGVTRHLANFATFTAPSFGTVHNRVVRKHTCRDPRRCDCRPEPCHARRDIGTCEHGRPAVCFARHEPDDPRLGQPFCLDCYDHDHQVIWNLSAGELWRRTKQAIERHLNRTCRRRGIRPTKVTGPDGRTRSIPPVRLTHGKAAEFQIRGAVHFHALIRVDGNDPHDPDAIVPPPAELTADDLDAAIRAAVARVAFTTPTHPDQPEGWPISWGVQVEPRPITLTGNGDITDQQVAGYLAKYATKGTETTGHASTRITPANIDDWADEDTHTGRLIDACWRLGRPDPTLTPEQRAESPYSRLRPWTHMLGFGGHFLTKARHGVLTFAFLRDNRVTFRRTDTTGPDMAAADRPETVLIVGTLNFAGTGWHTLGDALLANTSAAMARARHQTGREELAHELGSALNQRPVTAAA